MAVITFDFDDTLTQTQWSHREECFVFVGPNRQMCNTLREHVTNGDTVHIVTSRTGPDMDSEGNILVGGQPGVRAFLQEHLPDMLGKVDVHFTSGALKWMTLHELRSEKHFDDDPCELEALPPGIQGVRVGTLHGLD